MLSMVTQRGSGVLPRQVPPVLATVVATSGVLVRFAWERPDSVPPTMIVIKAAPPMISAGAGLRLSGGSTSEGGLVEAGPGGGGFTWRVSCFFSALAIVIRVSVTGPPGAWVVT